MPGMRCSHVAAHLVIDRGSATGCDRLHRCHCRTARSCGRRFAAHSAGGAMSRQDRAWAASVDERGDRASPCGNARGWPGDRGGTASEFDDRFDCPGRRRLCRSPSRPRARSGWLTPGPSRRVLEASTGPVSDFLVLLHLIRATSEAAAPSTDCMTKLIAVTGHNTEPTWVQTGNRHRRGRGRRCRRGGRRPASSRSSSRSRLRRTFVWHTDRGRQLRCCSHQTTNNPHNMCRFW